MHILPMHAMYSVVNSREFIASEADTVEALKCIIYKLLRVNGNSGNRESIPLNFIGQLWGIEWYP